MGVGGGLQAQGLWIKTRSVVWDQASHDLTRISEVGVVGQFGETPLNVAVQIRVGLRIGMLFRNGHTVGTDNQHHDRIEVAVWPKNEPVASLAGLPWQNLDKSNVVTNSLNAVFGNPGKWIGYQLGGGLLGAPPNTMQARLDERLYFRVRILNFTPHQNQRNDVHVVPMVCILEGLDFANHYALGIGAFTTGKDNNALEFDSQVLAYDPATQAARAAATSRGRRGPAKKPAKASKPPSAKRAGGRRSKPARRRGR